MNFFGGYKMKRKISLLLIAALCVFALAACGSGSSSSDAVVIPDDGYSFTYNGVTIEMHALADDVIEALGDYESYYEETSCSFEGIDKTYDYGSFYITTYPDGDVDYIFTVWFSDDTVATEEGISIGSSSDEVEAVYGTDFYNGSNAYIIESGEMTLTIIMSDDTVGSIQYTASF